MVNKNKRKGSDWEKQFVELLLDNIEDSTAKRIPTSGAIGTQMNESELKGDIKARFKGFDKSFRIEAKTGYGGKEQLTIKREWLNKISKEAKESLSYPMLACKFSGARESGGVQYFVILDFSTLCDIINSVASKEDILEKLSNGQLGRS